MLKLILCFFIARHPKEISGGGAVSLFVQEISESGR